MKAAGTDDRFRELAVDEMRGVALRFSQSSEWT